MVMGKRIKLYDALLRASRRVNEKRQVIREVLQIFAGVLPPNLKLPYTHTFCFTIAEVQCGEMTFDRVEFIFGATSGVQIVFVDTNDLPGASEGKLRSETFNISRGDVVPLELIGATIDHLDTLREAIVRRFPEAQTSFETLCRAGA
jgi:hypothetical protein